MQFLTHLDNDDRDAVNANFEAYKRYLEENRELFPPEAFAFASAEWHYDTSFHNCPHDAWVESCEILESASSYHPKLRQTDIQLKLLGPHHDGLIEISYENVSGYSLNLSPRESEVNSLRDWLVDEVRLTKAKRIVHEIVFWMDGNWQIECQNIRCKWMPFGSE